MKKFRKLPFFLLSCAVVFASLNVYAEEPEYRALDYVELGEYKGLEVTLQKIEVTDEDINEQITASLVAAGQLSTEGSGTAKNGDIVVIDYEATLDGEPFEGGSGENCQLTIGSGTYMDELETGILGMAMGETKDVEFTYPEDYWSPGLAGKKAVYTVTVKSIRQVPVLTDELVQTLPGGCTTAAEYTAYVRQSLMEQKKTEQSAREREDLYSQIYGNSTVKGYPADVVNYRSAQIRASYEDIATQNEMEFADFLEQYAQLSEEEFDDQVQASVQNDMVQELLLTAIAEKEGLSVSDSYYEEHLKNYVEDTGSGDMETLLGTYSEEQLRNAMLMDVVMDFVVDNCVVTNPEDATDPAENLSAGTETAEIPETPDTEQTTGFEVPASEFEVPASEFAVSGDDEENLAQTSPSAEGATAAETDMETPEAAAGTVPSSGEIADTVPAAEDITGTSAAGTSENQYPAGTYLVGTDIPAGEYMLFASKDSGYFCVTSAGVIQFNDSFATNSIITVEDGETLKLSRCCAVPFNSGLQVDTSGEGMFAIGLHLPTGEYHLKASEGKNGYFSIFSSSRQSRDNVVAVSNFQGERTVTVSDGQYLLLSRCSITD